MQSTIVTVDVAAEIRKQGFEFETRAVPEPQKNAPKYWALFHGPTHEKWEAIEPESAGLVPGIARSVAYRRACGWIEFFDADAIELAVKPNEETVFMTDSPPTRKGTTKRKVLVDYNDGSRPEEIEFRSVARTLWSWGRRGIGPFDLYEIAPNGGRGDDPIWLVPRDLVVPMPKELLGAAPDRVQHYERIVQRLAAAELETKLAEKVNVKTLASNAFAEHRETFASCPVPALVSAWSEESRRQYAELHEELCKMGRERYREAPALAIEGVIKLAADAIRDGSRLI